MEKENIRIKLEYEQLMKDYKNMKIKLKFEMEKSDLVPLTRQKSFSIRKLAKKIGKNKTPSKFLLKDNIEKDNKEINEKKEINNDKKDEKDGKEKEEEKDENVKNKKNKNNKKNKKVKFMTKIEKNNTKEIDKLCEELLILKTNFANIELQKDITISKYKYLVKRIIQECKKNNIILQVNLNDL